MTTDISGNALGREISEHSAAELGAVIRSRREQLGISLRAFARQCGLSPAHVSKVERGLASPSVGTLSRIVQELGLDGSDLFGTASAPTGASAPILVRAADIPVLASEPGSPEGSIVRLLARPDAGSILETFGGPDYFLPPTVAPADTIVLVLAGSVEVDLAGERVALGAGDSLVIPPQMRHSIRITGGLETHTLYLSPAGAQMLHDEPAPAA